MYGVYSFVNADRISLTVNVVNNERNEQRSFAAIGQPQAAVKSVAAQIFDTFQRTSSPTFINQNQCVPEKNTSIDKGLVVCIKDN